MSIEYPRGLRDEEDPLSQFPGEDGQTLDFALEDSFSIERGRDAVSVGLDDEFGSIKGFNDDQLDFGFEKPVEPFPDEQEDDGLGIGFGDAGGLDFGFGEDLPPQQEHDGIT